jgi:hypothetical protein
MSSLLIGYLDVEPKGSDSCAAVMPLSSRGIALAVLVQVATSPLDGTVISRNMKRHRHQEFIRFLNDIDAQVPKRKEVHAIVDNYATHKHPKVRHTRRKPEFRSPPVGQAAEAAPDLDRLPTE